MKRILALLLTVVLFCTVLTGCGRESIVGTWEEIKEDGYMTGVTFNFNEDGTCTKSSSTQYVSYLIRDDDTLVITMTRDRVYYRDKAESEEQALNDSRNYYYLSDEELILFGCRYEKQ